MLTSFLSHRLKTIADFVPRDSTLADIGSDHALLPVYLVRQGIVRQAIAGELNEGPFEAAKRQVQQAGLSDQVSVRRGDGLTVVQPGEVSAVTVAGMGGNLIASILETGKQRLQSVQTLVLQPNVGAETVRRWLHANGWLLLAETILEEDGHIYEVLQAGRTTESNNSSQSNEGNDSTRNKLSVIDLYDLDHDCLTVNARDWQFKLGPYLLRQPSTLPLVIKKWRHELEKWSHVREQLSRSQSEQSVQKYHELLAKQHELEGILKCLLTDKPSFN